MPAIVKPAFELSAADIKTEVLSVEKAAEKLVDRSVPMSSSPLAAASARMSTRASSWLSSWLLHWAAALWVLPVPLPMQVG